MSADNESGIETADEGRDFDWTDVDVVVAHQLPIGIYQNLAGDIVIRQRSDDYYDDDGIIWFSPEHARAIAAALLRVAGYPAPEPAEVGGKAKDGTGAARQRRRRARQKDEPMLDVDRDQDRDVTAENRDGRRDGQAA